MTLFTFVAVCVLHRVSVFSSVSLGVASPAPASPAAPEPSHMQPGQQASLSHCACDGQAWLKSHPEPRVPTPPPSPLWAPVALGCGLFNGATPVWEQPRAQDTGTHLSKLAIFSPKEPKHSDGLGGLAGCLPRPPPTSLSPMPLAPVLTTGGVWLRTSSSWEASSVGLCAPCEGRRESWVLRQ